MASRTGPIRKQIGPAKHHLSNKLKAAQDFLATPEPSDDSTSSVLKKYLESLQVAHESLMSATRRLQGLHDEWVVQIQDIGTDDEQKHYDDACDAVYALIYGSEDVQVQLTARKSRWQTDLDRTTSSVGPQYPMDAGCDDHGGCGANFMPQSTNPTFPQHFSAFKAPKISLPVFTGNYMDFKQFWGIYEANIHNRPDLSNIEKFTYLLTLLQGDAKTALAGITVKEDTYDDAVSLLRSRFDRADERMITLLYSEFMRIPMCSNKVAEKQRTLDACERIFRQLESVGEEVNSNKSLVFALLSKFPATMVKDLQRYYNVGPTKTLNEVRNALQVSVSEEETTTGILDDLYASGAKSQGKPTSNDKSNTGGAPINQKSSFYYSSTLAANSGRPNKNQTGYQRGENTKQGGVQMLTPPCSCYFCGEQHFNGECQRYPTAISRQRRLREVRRCTRCLKRHDRVRDGGRCPVPIKCIHCKTEENHASALCYRQYPESSGTASADNRPGTTGHATLSADTPAFYPTNPVHTLPESGIGVVSTPQKTPSQVNTHAGNNPKGDGTVAGASAYSALSQTGVKPALFQTAKTTAINPVTGETHVVRLAMDTMSSRSYITETAARALGLMGEKSEKIFVSVFGTSKSLEVPTTRVQFDVCLRNGRRQEIEANTTRVICSTSAIPDSWSDAEMRALNYFHSSLADDPYDVDGEVDVLVGANLVWEFVEGPRMSTSAPGLFLIPSKFGLMLSGECEREGNNAAPTMCVLDPQPLPKDQAWGISVSPVIPKDVQLEHTTDSKDEQLEFITDSSCEHPAELGLMSCETGLKNPYPDIDEHWLLERIGIDDDPTVNDDDRAVDKYERTVTFEEGRYQVTLPWIDEKRGVLPDNYDVAYNRLQGLRKRLRANPELLQGYRDILKLQCERGIIEEVPPDEIETNNTTHYLPHHPVIKTTSNTTKVRIVYDAAAKRDRYSVSLNECLFRGPVILPDLCQLLMRMRTHETVVISDIEKAFLQVGLQTNDRDVTRFLWFKDDVNLSMANNIKVYRFKRVNFGVISSPFLLAKTLDTHFARENTKFAESLRNDVYVDNVISGLEPGSESVYYHQLKGLFDRAGMNIQEFCSNSKSFMDSIPEKDRVKQTDVKVLGMKWDSLRDDTLRLVRSTKLISSLPKPTKRMVMQTVASVFDPLGLFVPATLPAKWFLQKLWKLKCGWDEPLSGPLQQEFNLLKSSLVKLSEHRIPRFVGRVENGAMLAVFCDASASAYSTAVYLRCPEDEDRWSSQLIFAKSRLPPQPKSNGDRATLPRLELLGALIGCRAGNFCRKGLKIPDAKIDFFIDSQCVLRWIRSRGTLKRFVANRIEEIRKSVNCEFHYVPSEDNPADYGTRGKLPEELFADDLWWNGPHWLQKDRSDWPKWEVPPITDKELEEIQTEMKPAYFGHTMTVTEAATTEKVDFLTIEPKRMPSLGQMLRISVVMLKFLKLFVWNRVPASRRKNVPVLKGLFRGISSESSITAQDYDSAKLSWVRCVQQNHFQDILKVLRGENNRRIPMISQLGLQLDDMGLIRTYGRFDHADLPDAARAPLLLPKGDWFSIMVIEDVHWRILHSGVSHTLSQVRMEFWIICGRALVRQVLHRCALCRRYKTAMPFRLPPMPSWPRERVSKAAPFKFIGLDYFGPVRVLVNDERNTMSVCLFTCLTTRAVHLEPVMDNTAYEFLHCLIRFVSRRGAPAQIISDNASNFELVKLLGDHAWKRVPTDEAIISYSAANGIRWKFITELAPWQGGFYERLVGVVKSTLRTSIRRKLLSWTDFNTLLAEAEAVVNSRPITYVADDVDSSYRVIRPSDFLIVQPSAVTDSPDGAEVNKKDFSGDAGKLLVAAWKNRCRTLEKLWRYWYEDYLLSLRERRTIAHPSGRSDVGQSPLLNEVVLLYDPDAPRGQWRLVRITRLHRSSDGRIRSADVVQWNGIALRRPINHLIPLEVDRNEVDTETNPADTNPEPGLVQEAQQGHAHAPIGEPESGSTIGAQHDLADSRSEHGADSSDHRSSPQSESRRDSAWQLRSEANSSEFDEPEPIPNRDTDTAQERLGGANDEVACEQEVDNTLDEGGFSGFSERDIQGTIDQLRRYEDVPDSGDDGLQA